MSEAAPQTAVVIDDDPDVRALLVAVLTSAGFTVHGVDNGTEGVDAVIAHDPVITTLDVNMPGIDGYETARRIREHSDTYIMLITALTDEADAILGFSAGADDVVVKPFRARELRARILAAQRRQKSAEPTTPDNTVAAGPRNGSTSPAVEGNGNGTAASAGHGSSPPSAARDDGADTSASARTIGWNGLELVRAVHRVTVDGREVTLTRTEFDLLATILEAAPEVRSKAELVHSLRDDPAIQPRVSEADERAIETHITNLRRKIGDSAAQPRFIETVRGVGYRAAAPAAG